MNIVSAEKLIKEKLDRDPTNDVFPITVVKYLLNRTRILSFFDKVSENEVISLQSYIDYDHSKCEACNENLRQSKPMLCRKHTSIDRVMKCTNLCIDVATGVFLYMNEIFKIYNDKLAIVYAPHTKLIQGSLTENKVKKVSLMVTENPHIQNFEEELARCRTTFNSNELMEMFIRCWFNEEFSLITIPDQKDEMGFCLVPNK